MISEYYISDSNLNTHNFIFDDFFNKKLYSRFFICEKCKIIIQLYTYPLTFKKNHNFSCNEMIIKSIIE